MAQWIVTRIVKETYDVDGNTYKEALNNAKDPYSVEIIKETAKKTGV